MRVILRLPLVAMLAVVCAAAAQTPALQHPEPATSESVAQLIGVRTDVARLQRLAGRSETGEDKDRWEMLWLHERIAERVMAASLQVDASIAQIDNEIARAGEVRGVLADRRDRVVSRANLLAAVLGGAVGATSSGLQLSSTLTKPAAEVGIGAGALSTGFAVAGIHAQAGKSSRFDFESNMLAELFDWPMLPNSQYPATVWTFLNEASPIGPVGLTRRQELIETWIKVDRIDSLSSREKIDRVSSQPSEQLKLSIDDFEDRAAMLQDVRAKISYLKRDLGTFLMSLQTIAEP